VSLGGDLGYALIEAKPRDGQRGLLVIASALVEKVAHRYGLEGEAKVLGHVAGQALDGVLLKHPFYAREVPVLIGDHVSADDGTGAVHTSPDHGVEDFVVSRKYGIETLNYTEARGTYRADTPVALDGTVIAGKHLWKANDEIVELLRRRGVLLAFAKIEHSYPHCWRHKTPVIFRTTPQWFISMEKEGLRKTALDAIKQVRWVPSWGEERIAGMVGDRPDWCISRQRTWGVPIALFIHKATQEPHPDSVALLEQVAKRMEQGGIDAWYALDAAELLGDQAKDYEKVLDVLDVWFDSGVSHFAVVGQRPELQQGNASRRLGSASRLVQVLVADLVGDVRPRAVPGRAHPRFYRGCAGPQDVQVAGQRHRAAGHHEDAGRRHPAPVDLLDRLPQRNVVVGRDPQARVGHVSPHPQHRALPARQP